MSLRFKIISLPLVSLLGIALSSCATPSTPETRTEAHPQIYEKLSDSDKKTVSKGQLRKGMSKDAVFLAWGKASRETDTFKDNKRTTRWDYTSLSPVYSNSFYGGVSSRYGGFGHSYGYGRYGRSGRFRGRGFYGGRGYYNGFGVGTNVYYQPKTNAQVLFENDKVTGWSVVK